MSVETSQPASGTAAWWLARRERRRRRSALTTERITGAAIDLLETAGPAAVTMRGVANALGTGQASLYRHVASRDELLAVMVDKMMRAASLAPPPDLTWRASMEWSSHQFRQHLLHHPAVVPFLDCADLLGPNSMAGREYALQTFTHAGFTPRTAILAYSVLATFILGSVRSDLARGTRDSAERRARRDLFAGQDRTRYPLLVEHAESLAAARDSDGEFALGLNAILDGIASLRVPVDEHH